MEAVKLAAILSFSLGIFAVDAAEQISSQIKEVKVTTLTDIFRSAIHASDPK
jgi:hypothetical protein